MFRAAWIDHSFTRFINEETQITPVYFDRPDVKEVIHAPADVDWTLCTPNVLANDSSLPPAFTVLPNVIEKSKRSVIVHGLLDFVLIAEGARIVLQK
jgi:carboxypeptidase D